MEVITETLSYTETTFTLNRINLSLVTPTEIKPIGNENSIRPQDTLHAKIYVFEGTGEHSPPVVEVDMLLLPNGTVSCVLSALGIRGEVAHLSGGQGNAQSGIEAAERLFQYYYQLIPVWEERPDLSLFRYREA